MSSVFVLCRGAAQNRTPVGVFASLEAAKAGASWLPAGAAWKFEPVMYDDWKQCWRNSDVWLPLSDWADIFEVTFTATPAGDGSRGAVDLGYTEAVLAEEVGVDDTVFVSWDGVDHRGRVHHVGFRMGSTNITMASTSWTVEVPHDYPVHRRPRS